MQYSSPQIEGLKCWDDEFKWNNESGGDWFQKCLKGYWIIWLHVMINSFYDNYVHHQLG